MSVSIEGWLPALVSNNRFFTPCSKCSDCHSARESSLNYWDIDSKEELCSICLQKEPRENVLQVRRGTCRGQIQSKIFLHWGCSFYGILTRNPCIVTYIGSTIIVSWCCQGSWYCEDGWHFSHTVVRDQWIQGVVPEKATSTTAPKGSCRGLPMRCLLETLAGCQLVLFVTVQDGRWQWSRVEGRSVHHIKQEWNARHANGQQCDETIHAVFVWKWQWLSRRVIDAEAAKEPAEAISHAVNSSADGMKNLVELWDTCVVSNGPTRMSPFGWFDD